MFEIINIILSAIIDHYISFLKLFFFFLINKTNISIKINLGYLHIIFNNTLSLLPFKQNREIVFFFKNINYCFDIKMIFIIV